LALYAYARWRMPGGIFWCCLAVMGESSHTPTIPSLPSGLVMSRLYLLIVPALGTGERTYFSGAVCRHDSSLVPVKDVAARLALLPEGNDRAALVDDLAASHLYRHPTSARKTRQRPYCMLTASFRSGTFELIHITYCYLKPTSQIACARAGVSGLGPEKVCRLARRVLADHAPS
jgi:hypothetical protein